MKGEYCENVRGLTFISLGLIKHCIPYFNSQAFNVSSHFVSMGSFAGFYQLDFFSGLLQLYSM